VHEEKKRVVAEWVATHGTPEQQARHAAGMLPMAEVVEGMTDEAFAALADWPRYQRGGAAQLQAHLCQFPQHADVVVTTLDLEVTSKNAVTATAEQWAVVQRIQALVPDATVNAAGALAQVEARQRGADPDRGGGVGGEGVGLVAVRREFSTGGYGAGP
jgi:hypothetical protein